MDASDGKHVCMLQRVPTCSTIPPTAGTLLYRTIICKLRSMRLPWSHHHGTEVFVRSAARLRAERARVRSITHPYSVAALIEEAINVTMTLAALLYAPLQVFIECPNPYDPFILFTDVMSFLHIVWSFTIGYVDEGNKQIVLDPLQVTKHYLRTFFLPDMIGALPLQVIHMFDDCRYPSQTIMLTLKLFKLPTFIKQIRSLVDQIGLSYVKRTLYAIAIKLILFFHWMTYIHYQVPCFHIHYFSESERNKVWKKRFITVHMEDHTIFQRYMSNLFLVCGLCIGAGYYNPVDEYLISDLILTSLLGLAGIVFLTYTYAVLVLLAIYMQNEKNIFNGKSKQLYEYMTYKRLPKFLQRKIQLFMNYKYNGHYFNDDVIMNTINEQIRQDINMYGCKKMVAAVPLFQDMPVALINAIVFRLTQALYMPGEVLVKSGDISTCLFMIISGTVAVINVSGREIAHLRDGSHFGETALLQPGKARTGTIVALEITEIYKLENKEFLSCLQPYPHLRRRLEENYVRGRYGSLRPDPLYHTPQPSA